MIDANAAKVSSMHFYGWNKGLKTGMYYLRTKAAADAIQFTIDAEVKSSETITNLAERTDETVMADIACSIDTPEDCFSCGS